MRNLIRLTLACVVAVLPAGGEARPSAGQSYERWVRPQPLTAAERQALRVVRAWGREHGRRIRHDARLSHAACALLPALPDAPEGRIDLTQARAAAERWGWSDGQLAAVTLRVERGVDLRAELRRQLAARIGKLEVNRAGLAIQADRDGSRLLLLLSRRLVDLVPLPSRVARGSQLRIAGGIRGDAHAGRSPSLLLVVQAPGGEIRRMPLSSSSGLFEREIEVGSKAGVLRVELMLARGHGPEIAALFPVGVDADPWREAKPLETVPPEAEPPETELHGEEGDDAALSALILGARAARGRSLLVQSSRLADAARAYADEMAHDGFFAHVSPRGEDVTARLSRRGVHYVRALENIAIGSSVEAIFHQWMTSPAHLANLLDSRVTTLGVGVAARTDAAGTRRLVAVAVLAQLADDGGGAELAARARGLINEQRRRLRLPPLADDPKLDRLAARHSREVAALDEVTDTIPTRGSLVDTVFSEVEVTEAAADVYLAAGIDVVTRSQHIRERFSRAGVGVHRDPTRSGAQLWITVIYAAD